MPELDRPEMPRSVSSAALGVLGCLIATGIIAAVSMYAQMQSFASSIAATQQAEQHTAEQLAKHLDHAVDKDDYLRDKAAAAAAMQSMATKEDVHALREMILDLLTTGPSKADKYRAGSH